MAHAQDPDHKYGGRVAEGPVDVRAAAAATEVGRVCCAPSLSEAVVVETEEAKRVAMADEFTVLPLDAFEASPSETVGAASVTVLAGAEEAAATSGPGSLGRLMLVPPAPDPAPMPPKRSSMLRPSRALEIRSACSDDSTWISYRREMDPAAKRRSTGPLPNNRRASESATVTVDASTHVNVAIACARSCSKMSACWRKTSTSATLNIIEPVT